MEVGYLQRVGLSVSSNPSHVLQRRGAPAVGGKMMASTSSSAPPVAPPPSQATSSSAKGSTKVAKTFMPPGGGCQGPCCFLGNGFAAQAIERPGRAPWYLPTEGVNHGITVMNSLTGEKEPFIPKDGNKIRWYNCGPTVYDVSHMGHARAYLTFDILRRIIKDYFKYDVLYQINITDIDDKIILRSRQNKLFQDFSDEMAKKDLKALIKVVDEAVELAEKKLIAKKPVQPKDDAPGRERDEFTKLCAEHELKMGQLGELKAKVTAAKGARDTLLVAARDPLMAKLDKERGHTVTDHSIFDSHARHFEDTYFEDMDNLGVERPDIKTRISDYMDGRVQKFIEKLEDDGFCYNSNGSVYFNIDNFNKAGYNYRKLVPAASATAAEMDEGEGALADETAEKKNANDFAVWKKSKPGEPAWESRWGPGRPGWHIECSVMATDIHKEFLDIHGGGEDLKFPHHDNEMAQSEAYLKSPQWVNYFWHAGHLSIAGLKMSKSLKNFITIRQALDMHTARQMRIMFLMQPWDGGMNYSDQAMDMAKAEERKFKHVLGSLKFYQRGPHSKGKSGEREAKLLALVKKTEDDIGVALRDNFTTSKVISVLSTLATECYPSFEALPDASLEPVEKASELIQRILGIVGVDKLVPEPANAAAWTPALDAFAGLRQQIRLLAKNKAPVTDVIAAIVKATPAVKAAEKAGITECAKVFKAFNDDLQGMAKANKAWPEFLKRCDEVRDRDFISLGIRLEDKASEGFLWMFDDREVMQREIAEQAEKVATAAKAKLTNKLTQKKTELKVAEKAAVKPEDLFRSTGLYDGFDEAGIPSKLKSGEEVSAKKKKDFVKDLAKHQKEYEKLVKQAGAAGVDAFVAKLRADAEELEKQIGSQ